MCTILWQILILTCMSWFPAYAGMTKENAGTIPAHITVPNAAPVPITLEVATDLDKGLMRRKSLPADTGMVFDFSQRPVRAMWMKDTVIPLDMLFLDAAGKVIKIHQNAKPLDETPIPAPPGTTKVIEVNAGWVTRHGITVGSCLHKEPAS